MLLCASVSMREMITELCIPDFLKVQRERGGDRITLVENNSL